MSKRRVPGIVLGRYRLCRPLGAGAMGEVWEADDTGLRRRVALKLMAEGAGEGDEVAEARFVREAQAAAAVSHPNVVAVHDAGKVDGECFLAMELVTGASLREHVDGSRPQAPMDRKALWLRQIAAGLGAIHDKGIVHRDIKPENVLVRTDGSACIVDLGIAKWFELPTAPTLALGAAETAENLVVGTPDYLPPETRLAGWFDAQSDQYAWGVTSYELLTGLHPNDVAFRSLRERPEIPPRLAEATDRALSRLPTDRFASMNDLVLSLDEPTTARARTLAPPRRARKKPKRWPFLLGLVGAVTVGTFAVVVARRTGGPAMTLATASVPAPLRAIDAAAAPLDAAPEASSSAVTPPPRPAATSPRSDCLCIKTWHDPVLCPIDMPAQISGRCIVRSLKLCHVPWEYGGCAEDNYIENDGAPCTGYTRAPPGTTTAQGITHRTGYCGMPRNKYRGPPGRECTGRDEHGHIVAGHVDCSTQNSR